jgi:hypothetical protein
MGEVLASMGSSKNGQPILDFQISRKRDDHEYAEWQDYASADTATRLVPGGCVTHPRDTHNKWKLKEQLHIPVLDTFNEWLDDNVKGYLKTKKSWGSFVGPNRFLFSYGPRGAGRSSAVTTFCAENNINLYYIKNSFYESGQMLKIFKFAQEHQPCIVYFDGAHHIMSNAVALEYLTAAIRHRLNFVTDNVWTVLSSHAAPTVAFPYGTNVRKLLHDSGNVVSTPALTDNSVLQSVVAHLLWRLSGCNDLRAQDEAWTSVLGKMALRAQYHTAGEIHTFLVGVFRAHLSGLLQRRVDRQSIVDGFSDKCPSPEMFHKYMDNCSNEKGELRLSSLRNPKTEFYEHDREWRSFCQVNNIQIDQRPQDKRQRLSGSSDIQRQRIDAREYRDRLEQEASSILPFSYSLPASPVGRCTSFIDDGDSLADPTPLGRLSTRQSVATSRQVYLPPPPPSLPPLPASTSFLLPPPPSSTSFLPPPPPSQVWIPPRSKRDRS